MDAEKKLHVVNLSCVRQQKLLFSDISFQLKSGEMLLVEGRNGAGKSSLLRLLTGLSTPAKGDIFWQGNAIQQARSEYGENLHFISHFNGIKLGLTVLENLQLIRHFSLSSSSISITSTLERLQLSHYENVLAKDLSAGQKRRLALAKLFLVPKLIWILDEPLTALDINTQTLFLSALDSHLHHGGMAIISSHHTDIFTHTAIKTLRLAPC
ncbi:MAG: cytochrome c biogenesis heme-transporting ATPase CcmA [Gammaproteobacteria bacterium]|nr:cytochrome c biogenesis heme-transporting ATPase CcmA [Gammaproteobacteria bacterium]MCW5582878.1 cytochrome c biogenesis heme-transporting ATPase CcmA [Gammaproteobacteria bacterium]